MEFKTLIDKNGGFWALLDLGGKMELVSCTVPQLMAITAEEGDLEKLYPGIIDWYIVDLVTVAVIISKKY